MDPTQAQPGAQPGGPPGNPGVAQQPPLAAGAPGKPQPQGGNSNIMMILMSFLAGAGLKQTVEALTKLMVPGGGKGAGKGQGGAAQDAAKAAQMSLAAKQQAGQGPQVPGQQANASMQQLMQQLLR